MHGPRKRGVQWPGPTHVRTFWGPIYHQKLCFKRQQIKILFKISKKIDVSHNYFALWRGSPFCISPVPISSRSRIYVCWTSVCVSVIILPLFFLCRLRGAAPSVMFSLGMACPTFHFDSPARGGRSGCGVQAACGTSDALGMSSDREAVGIYKSVNFTEMKPNANVYPSVCMA